MKNKKDDILYWVIILLIATGAATIVNIIWKLLGL